VWHCAPSPFAGALLVAGDGTLAWAGAVWAGTVATTVVGWDIIGLLPLQSTHMPPSRAAAAAVLQWLVSS
jgi:hypothetical protein